MEKRNQKKIILNGTFLFVILLLFLITNIQIDKNYKEKLKLVSDGPGYCYGIDSYENDGKQIKITGWFLELKNVQNIPQKVSNDDAELILALVPVEEAIARTQPEHASFMKVEKMHEKRPDVNEYFSCEYDYTKCGFVATIDCTEVDLLSNSYRLVIKTDARGGVAVLVNVYITDSGILYTDPSTSPILETTGTDLDKIVKEGMRLVSLPEFHIYVYQLKDKLYWIADEEYEFCENGETFIQFNADTTQFDKLPEERLANKWYSSSIGDYFEKNEITEQITCGRYRVMMREIPRDYSVTSLVTGYYQKEWIWGLQFKPCYAELLKDK